LGFGLAIVAIALACTAPAQAEKRIALVVGNSSYQHISPLDNPVNDARLMAETLMALGFDLVGGGAQIDLDKAGFDAAVQRFGNEVQAADVALFYYAGHGVQVNGANYLVPVGANPIREADVDFQMLDVALVLRQMEDTRARLKIVILDACRNNPFGGRGLRAIGRGLAQIQAPEGTVISYATQPGNVALDGSAGNSPYTKALAATMRRPNLSIFETFNEVGLTVKRATGGRQQPWVASSPIDGMFYFVPPQAALPTSAPQLQMTAQPSAESLLWDSIKESHRSADFNAYLEKFPNGLFAQLARGRLSKMAFDGVWSVKVVCSGASDGTKVSTKADSGHIEA
jgi:uncharacterized caspase-like protein